MRPLGATILSFFFRGLLLLVPVTLILWASWQALTFLDGIIPLDIPGLGLLSLLVIITVVGWLGSSFLYTPIAAHGRGVAAADPLPENAVRCAEGPRGSAGRATRRNSIDRS